MRRRLPIVLMVTSVACFNPEGSVSTTDDTGSTGPGTTTMVADEGSTSTDTGENVDSGCLEPCDDAIACTDDACVDGECIHTPVDAMCDDGVTCTVDTCDATMGCTNAPNDAMCDDGVTCTVDACDATMGCTATPDDAVCDDGVTCTVDTCDVQMDCVSMPDDTACEGCGTRVCDPRLDCQVTGGTVLVFNGGGAPAPENAVMGLGYMPLVVNDEGSFIAAFDAGGFDAIVFDVPGLFTPVPPEVQSRLDEWVSSGERLVFGFWDLDVDPAMQATLDVAVASSFDEPRPIHPDPASPVDLFGMPSPITPPITYPDGGFDDNGDHLELAGPGFIAARFDDPVAGTGAVLVTHDDRVVVNGFLIGEIGFGINDGDGDGINDGEELLRNELALVCDAP